MERLRCCTCRWCLTTFWAPIRPGRAPSYCCTEHRTLQNRLDAARREARQWNRSGR